MRSAWSWAFGCVVALVGAGFLVGCSGGECRGSLGLNASRCGGLGTRARYRLTSLHFPTRVEAQAGELVGVDLDGVDGACEVPDYPGSVDNALVDFVALLPALMPDAPIDLQADLDAGLFCTAGDAGCVGTVIDLRVTPLGGRLARVELLVTEGGSERVVGVDDEVSVDADGRFEARFDRLGLELPTDDGAYQGELDLPLRDAVVGGVLELEGIAELVVGGTIHEDDLWSRFITPQWLPLGPDYSYPGGPLRGLYDVVSDPDEGVCDGFSVGLTGTARALPAHLF